MARICRCETATSNFIDKTLEDIASKRRRLSFTGDKLVLSSDCCLKQNIKGKKLSLGTMAARIWPLVKLVTKVSIAGGAVYVACDSGLLGSSDQGSEALQKAKAAVPPALEEWMKYFGLEAQFPAMPKIEFSPVNSWNSGVRWTISSLSEAPTRASEYTNQGLQYVKELMK